MLAALVAVAIADPPWNPKTGASYGPFEWNETTGKTMNGEYFFGTGYGKDVKTHRGTHYFEVVTPSYFSQYAQVNWDSMTIELNSDILTALNGQLVNFVGYEFDMVETTPSGVHTPIPAWELYNHHYGNTVFGKGSRLVKTGVPVDHDVHARAPMSDEALFPGYKIVNSETPATEPSPIRTAAGVPTNGGLIVGNGDESRKTFHYFAKGYGVQVESPQQVGIHPMLIDTKNREGTGTASRPTGHGIVPNMSNVPSSAMYSGIHECPCTDKWPKKISSFSTLKTGTCSPLITDPVVCFTAAIDLGLNPVIHNITTASPNLPSGCSVQAVSGGFEIVFNSNTSTKTMCGKPSVPSGVPSGPVLPSTCNLTGTWMQMSPTPGSMLTFKPSGTPNGYIIYNNGKAVSKVIAYQPESSTPQGSGSALWGSNNLTFVLSNWTADGSPVCTEIFWSNNVVFAKMPYANNKPVPTVLPRVTALAEDLINITVDIDPAKDQVTIVLQGPADVWFGAGFGYHHVSTNGADPSVGVSMVGTNWTIVVLGDGTVTERQLGNHEAGLELPLSVNVTSNTVIGNSRTVTMTRSIAGPTIDNFFFDPNANQLTYINAIGSGPFLMHHFAKSSNVMYFVELDYPTCLCDVAADQGSIGGYSWGTQRCTPRPDGQMLDDPGWESNKRINPSCDIHAYRGGLRCCKGGTVILDSDQNVTNNYLWEWQLKFRYYYEIVTPQNPSINTYMTSWWTEHNNGEHDVPKCDPSNPATCDYTITSNFTVSEMGGCENGCSFITMEGHCHIGCNRMEMWIVDDPHNPVLLCNASIRMGESDGWMDEAGYVSGAMTCIFGPGAAEIVPLHPTTKLMSVKVSNSTDAYTGDMALWEINAAPLPAGHVFNFDEKKDKSVAK